MAIDLICDGFESAWQNAGLRKLNPPSIQGALSGVDDALRPSLAIELALLDIDYRERFARPIDLSHYRVLGEDCRRAIDAVLQSSGDADAECKTVIKAPKAPVALRTEDTHWFPSLPARRIGRFRILQELGRGSFGIVFSAWDVELQREVAIKVAKRTFRHASGIDNDLREARLAASLDHPAIVSIYEVGRRPDGSLYVVCQIIHGTNLKSLMAQTRLPTEESLQIVATIAEAAGYAHERGLVHRDIKPANILVDGQRRPYLADFGLATRTRDQDAEKFAGSPAYMSPEQADGDAQQVDGRADIFSLGVTLYQMVYGRLPFPRRSRDAVWDSAEAMQFVDYSTDDPTVTEAIQSILRRAMSYRRADRYDSAKSFADALRECIAPTSAGNAAAPFELTHLTPRGLEPFTSRDALHFQELVPGPRDADGVPEAISFWTSRVACETQATPFRVGVLYGPSGAGKSSLFRAGVLPRLEKNVVTAFVAATPHKIEADCVRAIHRAIPSIEPSESLTSALGNLQQWELPSDKKLLLVVDQFEQWLHGVQNYSEQPFAAALRQCDGSRVQMVLLVRDDYWYKLNQCLSAAEIPTGSDNCRASDPFDVPHAVKVLRALGRAFGRYQDDNPDNAAFVDAAVAEMAKASGPTPVQLSLFVEFMKCQPWTRSQFKRAGGFHGATLRVLDQAISSDLAHPILRENANETGLLLRSMLPTVESGIKAEPQSIDDLIEASGLEATTLRDILGVLGQQLRIVSSSSDPNTHQPQYQLAHDYLVPIIRQWSQRTLGETFAGRMELLLEDRAKSWRAKPTGRNLPGPLEFAGILLSTKASSRSNAAQRMLRAARRRFALLAGLGIAFLICVFFVVSHQAGRYENRKLIEQLATATTAATEPIILKLASRSQVEPAALRQLRDRPDNVRNRWAASLVLAGHDHHELATVVANALEGDAQQLGITTRVLKALDCVIPKQEVARCTTQMNSAIERLQEDSKAAGQLLAAGALLAAFAPDHPDWPRWSGPTTNVFADIPEPEFHAWIELFVPVRDQLKPAVLESLLLADRRQLDLTDVERPYLQLTRRCGMIAARIGGDETAFLAAAVESASPDSFPPLLTHLAAAPDALPNIQARIDALETPSPMREPIALPEQIVKLLGNSPHVVTGHSLVAFDLPMAVAQELNMNLNEIGYYVVRCRPSATAPTRFSGIWRGGTPKACASIWGGTREEILNKDEELGPMWSPSDVVAYWDTQKESVRYCAWWTQSNAPRNEQIRIYDWSLPISYISRGSRFPRGAYALHAVNTEEAFVFAVIEGPEHRARTSDSWAAITHLPVDALHDVAIDTRFIKDIVYTQALDHDGLRRSKRAMLELPYATAQAELSEQRDIRRTLVLYDLGKYAEVYELRDTANSESSGLLHGELPAVILASARVGETEWAKKKFQEYLKLGPDPSVRWPAEAILNEFCGGDGLALLSQLREKPLWQDQFAPRAAAAAFEIAAFRKESAMPTYEAAIEAGSQFLRETIENRDLGHDLLANLNLATAANAHHELRRMIPTTCMHVVQHTKVGVDQVVVEGPVATVREEARQFGRRGYLPTSIASRMVNSEQRFTVLMVRLAPMYSQSILRARKAARLQTALSCLSSCWNLGTDDTVNYDMCRLAHQRGVKEELLWQTLSSDDPNAQYFALLAIGNYSGPLSDARRDRLASLYTETSHAGVHSAARFALDRRGCTDLRKSCDLRLAGKRAEDRQWSMNRLGMTFVRIDEQPSFRMGSPGNEPKRWPQVETLHRCQIPYTFAISATEVTADQYRKVGMPSRVADPDMPQHADWFDAVRFCRLLDEKLGIPERERCYPPVEKIRPDMTIPDDYWLRHGHRLPTDAEWELACRGESQTMWFFGNDERALTDFAVVRGRSCQATAGRIPGPNGLFDMHGNLSEWCQGKMRLRVDPLEKSPRLGVDGFAMPRSSKQRVVRGGSFYSEIGNTRSAARSSRDALDRTGQLGFRVVRRIQIP